MFLAIHWSMPSCQTAATLMKASWARLSSTWVQVLICHFLGIRRFWKIKSTSLSFWKRRIIMCPVYILGLFWRPSEVNRMWLYIVFPNTTKYLENNFFRKYLNGENIFMNTIFTHLRHCCNNTLECIKRNLNFSICWQSQLLVPIQIYKTAIF